MPAGDIAAVLALKDTFTGDTLCEATRPIILESITFPDPVIHIAIEPKSTVDQDKMGEALRRLAEEDPTFKVSSNEQTGQTILGLARLAQAAGSTIVGVGTVIEKTFEGGRAALKTLNVPIESLAMITDMDDGKIVLA